MRTLQVVIFLAAWALAGGSGWGTYQETGDFTAAVGAGICVLLAAGLGVLWSAIDVARDAQARGNPVRPGDRPPP